MDREELLKREYIAEQAKLEEFVTYKDITFNKLSLVKINFILDVILSDNKVKDFGFDPAIVEKSKFFCLKAKSFFSGETTGSDLDLLCAEAFQIFRNLEGDTKNHGIAEIVWSCMYPEGEENYPHDIKIDQDLEVYFYILFKIGSGLCASFREYAVKNW